jgi:hypothetical protein
VDLGGSPGAGSLPTESRSTRPGPDRVHTGQASRRCTPGFSHSAVIEPESQQRINVVIELRVVIEELCALLETRAARTGNGRAVEGTGPSWPRSPRERRAPALWRGGEVQLDRLAAGARARLDGELVGAGLEDHRRGLLGAVDADPGVEHSAARAVATRLVRCQSEALAHHASTLAAARRAVNRKSEPQSFAPSSPSFVRWWPRGASASARSATTSSRPAHDGLGLRWFCEKGTQ